MSSLVHPNRATFYFTDKYKYVPRALRAVDASVSPLFVSVATSISPRLIRLRSGTFASDARDINNRESSVCQSLTTSSRYPVPTGWLRSDIPSRALSTRPESGVRSSQLSGIDRSDGYPESDRGCYPTDGSLRWLCMKRKNSVSFYRSVLSGRGNPASLGIACKFM